MENIDVILYINLEHRLDRKEHFLNEMKKLCVDESKIIRVDAIQDEYGILGCGKSHTKAVELFMENPDWNTCIIFEDDYTLYDTSIENNNNRMKAFFDNFDDWGMLLLSSNKVDTPTIKTEVDFIELISYSQTASGYCINKKHVKELYDKLKEACILLEKTRIPSLYANDVYWNHVSFKRYSFCPDMGYQYGCYSDIEKRVVDYKV